MVIPVLTQHYAMLKRNLLYTGVTRGKRLVVLVAQKKAVAIAVRNASSRQRWSKLDECLAPARSSTGNRNCPGCPVSSGAAVDQRHALRVIGEHDRTSWWGAKRVNKAEMVDRLAARTGLSKSVAKKAVDGVFAVIGDALANGEEVRITGFGTFGTRSRPARTGRNPRTGETVSISASKSPSFKAGKTLKDVVIADPGS